MVAKNLTSSGKVKVVTDSVEVQQPKVEEPIVESASADEILSDAEGANGPITDRDAKRAESRKQASARFAASLEALQSSMKERDAAKSAEQQDEVSAERETAPSTELDVEVEVPAPESSANEAVADPVETVAKPVEKTDAQKKFEESLNALKSSLSVDDASDGPPTED